MTRFAPIRRLPATLHRLVVVASCAAALSLLALPASPAQAEILDYDPNTGSVPELLLPEERALLEQARSAGAIYLLTELGPGGRYVLAFVGTEVGFIDLTTGALVAMHGEGIPGSPATNYRWIDEDTLGVIHVEMSQPSPDEPPTAAYYTVAYSAADGTATHAQFDAEALGGGIVDVGPGLGTFVVIELPPAAPPARFVEIGPTFEPEKPGAPEGIPGLVGDRLLDGMELQQAAFTLALVDADGSNRRELVTLPADSGLAMPTWSSDGSRLALTTRTMPYWQSARDRGDDPPVPGTPNLGSINVREALGLVPPDENPLVTGTSLTVFETASGDALKRFENADYPQGTLAGIGFSPGGGHALLVLALRSDLEGRPHPTYAYPSGVEMHLLDDSLGTTRRIEGPGLDLLATQAAFMDDERLLFVTADELDNRMAVYDLAGSTLAPAWGTTGGILQMLARDGRVVFSHGDIDRPWEIWAGAVPTDPGAAFEPTPVTDFYPEAADLGGELRSEPVSWKTSDGERIHGLYVHHADMPFPPAEPGPLVVWQLGGPGGQMLRDYGATVEAPYGILPHFGLPVLIANAAGRTVKSPAFYSSMADGPNFGQLDIAQVREGIEALARQGIVHPGRVGITGCSYGGYFTLQSLRTYPDVYRAGNAQCSLVDLTEEFTFGYAPFIAYLMGRAPMADPQEYLRDSPYLGAGDIRSRLLLFHGTDDFLPLPLINNIHDELDANDVPVTFLRVAGEGHGFSRDESQLYAAQLQIRFFREHLVEADVGPPPTYGTTAYLPASFRNAAP